MAKTKQSDRRRKRSSPSSEEAPSSSRRGGREFKVPSWAGLLLILTAGFILSSFSSDEVDPRRLEQEGQLMQRRSLLNNEDRVMDMGVEENVWRRQLRVRKDQNNKQNNNDVNNNQRKLKATEEEERSDEDVMERPMRRMAVIDRYADKHHFEECVGKTIEECQTLIDTFVTDHTEDFNNQTTLYLDIRKVRELTDDSYYKVVIRTNEAGTQAFGLFDDGVIYYPWPWRLANGEDATIGPWDCELMSPMECCSMIQSNAAVMDSNGNYLACFIEEPVGGLNNPEREDRAIAVTDGLGKIVRAPVAH